MEGSFRLGRLSGVVLAVGGVGFLLAGVLHPSGSPGQRFEQAISSMLESPTWPAAHWIGLVSILLLGLAVWLLVDADVTQGSILARAGARLVILSSVFMAVEVAVEIAARGEVEAYTAGQAAPLINLIDPMQAVGWPALSLGWILLAVGCGRGLAPRWVVLIGAVGAAAMGLAGLLVQGLHIIEFGPLFTVQFLLDIWFLWAGVQLARGKAGIYKTSAAEGGTAPRGSAA